MLRSRHPRSSWSRTALLLLMGTASACTREHALFELVASAGAAGAAGAAGGAAGGAGGAPARPPWSDCDLALRHGEAGEACIGEFSCQERRDDCCSLWVKCAGGLLRRDPECGGCAPGGTCQTDVECQPGQWCETGLCVPCPSDRRCRPGWGLVNRNGCAWCAPPNECLRDQDCGLGLECYAGQHCLPGCEDDPSCCQGNLCSLPGCSSVETADCSRVGCRDRLPCVGEQRIVGCRCVTELGGFVCENADGSSILNACSSTP